jgi:hypothetical protein
MNDGSTSTRVRNLDPSTATSTFQHVVHSRNPTFLYSVVIMRDLTLDADANTNNPCINYPYSHVRMFVGPCRHGSATILLFQGLGRVNVAKSHLL